MTINDLSCDVCGRFLPGPTAGVRFSYHPGVEPDMRAWSGRTGNELLGISKDSDVFHVLLRRLK